jgi:hypothetical protein
MQKTLNSSHHPLVSAQPQLHQNAPEIPACGTSGWWISWGPACDRGGDVGFRRAPLDRIAAPPD